MSYRVFIGYRYWPVSGPLSLILTNFLVISRKARHKSAHFIAILRRNLVYFVANLVPIPDTLHPTILRRVSGIYPKFIPEVILPVTPIPVPIPDGFFPRVHNPGPVLLAEVVLDLRDELIGTTVNSNNQSRGESTRGMLFTRFNSCDV
jgi:hypothetical protein